jgi:hypothetical protein
MTTPATSTLPTSGAGPVPAVGDRVQVDGQTWEVWDVQTTPAGGHEVVLFAENPDDDTRWHAPGSLTTIPWQATAADTLTQPGPMPADQAGPPTVDVTARTHPADRHTTGLAHPFLAGSSPQQALDPAHQLPQRALDDPDELAAEHAPDTPDLNDHAELGL